ncbi:hypothetical protein [Flavobacterium suzhouense]|uniref:IrrE N-terminal-like domain-containing protein n=1 Tax=Flavobacterium suzhouense TaxID=1529638 RepID=A0ABW5NZ65_9FLAO
MKYSTEYLQKCIQFLESIGIKVIEKELDDTCFLPGLLLGSNTIYIDHSKIKYPGDILHEAGHIAVTGSNERTLIGTNQIPENWPSQGDEIAAILWSYAALKHLDLPCEFVFHKDGYKGHSDWYIENFTNQNYIGLPLLQWFGMAYSKDDAFYDEYSFPKMKQWIRQ